MTDLPETPPENPVSDAPLAAEYVLRLLPPADEAAFKARLEGSPALRTEVAQWRTRLEGLNSGFAEVAPPATVKAALQARLFGDAPRRVPLLARLGLWQGVSFAALAFAGFMVWQQVQPPLPSTLYVTEITAEDQSLRLLAVYDSARAELRLTRTNGTAPDGRVLELWGIEGDSAPVSLGVLPDSATTVLSLPEPMRASVSGLVLAITDEPPGGAPGGIATGTVLAIGQISEI